MQAARGTALSEPPAARQQPRRRILLLLAVAILVYAADVISKVLVVATLSGRPPIRLLGGLVHLLVLRNSGAAFSIGTGMTIVFTLIAVVVIGFILRTSRRLRSLPWAITLGLLLGGATGNLTDRLLRAPGVLRGDVVDWIQLPHWPVFNIADSCIVCGGILAVLLAAGGYRLDGTREGHPVGTRPAGSKSVGGGPGSTGPASARPGSAGPEGAGPEGAKPEGARPEGAGPEGAKPEGAKPEGAKPEGAGPEGAVQGSPGLAGSPAKPAEVRKPDGRQVPGPAQGRLAGGGPADVRADGGAPHGWAAGGAPHARITGGGEADGRISGGRDGQRQRAGDFQEGGE